MSPRARQVGAASVNSVAIVIPTVAGREADLRRCLDGVGRQTRPPDEVVVVRGCASYVSAVWTGVARSSAEWIAFLDDDSVPEAEWLEVLAQHFSNEAVGAIGGRINDFVEGRHKSRTYERGPVARVSWLGRTTSRLYDSPSARVVEDVDFLAGSNMCFRRVAVPARDDRLDEGMAPGFELALCLETRRSGWRVLFDSDAVVSHYAATRPSHLIREDGQRASYEYSYMLTYALLKNFAGPRRLAFLVYFFVLGQRSSPGLILALRFAFPEHSRKRFAAAWAGKLRGLQAAHA